MINHLRDLKGLLYFVDYNILPIKTYRGKEWDFIILTIYIQIWLVWVFVCLSVCLCPINVKTAELGFPPEFRVTVYVRKWSGNFFHFHYGKGSGKPEFRNDFRNVPEYRSGNFPKNRSGNFRFSKRLVS